MLDKETDKLVYIKERIRSFMDFPKTGIDFKDVFSILSDPVAFSMLNDIIIQRVKAMSPPPQCVVGLEARGFLFGPSIALALKVPFVPIRKKGKLPGKVRSTKYQLEYGEDLMEMQEEYINEGMRVLLVDDLLATGGTLQAACRLLCNLHLNPTHCLCIIELEELNGRTKLPCTTKLDVLIKF